MRKEILMMVMVLGLLSCKKEEDAPTTETTNVPVSTGPICFQSVYDGNYTGSGFLDSSGTQNPYTTGYLTVSKTDCQTADVGLSVPAKSYYFFEHITNLTSSSSGYSGKRPNGKTVTMSLGSGNHIYVTVDSAFTFNGTKP